MHALQAEINERWRRRRTAPSSASASASRRGEVAAALLGSEERLEYTLVGDTVNLTQRLQQLAVGRRDRHLRADEGGADPSTCATLIELDAQLVKGRDTPVVAFKIAAAFPGPESALMPSPTTKEHHS